MIIRPAGSSSDEDESGNESGYSEASLNGDPRILKTSLQDAIENGSIEEIEQILAEIIDYENFKLPNGYAPFVYAASLG